MTDAAVQRAVADNPLQHSALLRRIIRQDSVETLGVSTQTLAEHALEGEAWELAADLIAYFSGEMSRIEEALLVWFEDIVAYRLSRTVGGYLPMSNQATSHGA